MRPVSGTAKTERIQVGEGHGRALGVGVHMLGERTKV